MMSTCKVITQANEVKHSLSDLVSAMRKLRVARRLCERCPEQDCPFIRQLSAETKSALLELSDEWNL